MGLRLSLHASSGDYHQGQQLTIALGLSGAGQRLALPPTFPLACVTRTFHLVHTAIDVFRIHYKYIPPFVLSSPRH